MARRRFTRSDNVRRLVAHEAARMMSEQGIDDFFLAKRKAADRLGVTDQSKLPRNAEIEAALVENQRLFDADRHRNRLNDYRKAAREALHQFAEFAPRAAGAVLSGAVAEGTDLELHFFTDTPERVSIRFMDSGIPFRLVDRRIRTSANDYRRYPGYRFFAGEVPVLVLVFPCDGIRQSPVSPVDGRPMRRADLGEIETLIESGFSE